MTQGRDRVRAPVAVDSEQRVYCTTAAAAVAAEEEEEEVEVVVGGGTESCHSLNRRLHDCHSYQPLAVPHHLLHRAAPGCHVLPPCAAAAAVVVDTVSVIKAEASARCAWSALAGRSTTQYSEESDSSVVPSHARTLTTDLRLRASLQVLGMEKTMTAAVEVVLMEQMRSPCHFR